MKQTRNLICFAALFVVAWSTALPLRAQESGAKKAVDYDYLLPWDKKALRLPPTAEAQAREPFQIFDNLYYVGPQTASTYLIKSDKGLILIDPTYNWATDMVLANIRKLGFDPADIKYILITHGHWDHTSGVYALQKASGARVGMAAQDWEIYETPQAAHPYPTIPRDLVFKEGDVLKLGNTTIHFHVTPGHTPGCLSMEYTVYDHGKPYEALSLGGTGFNFPAEWTRPYIESMQRMRALPKIQVLLPDHPQINDVLELGDKLPGRAPGQPHPFVQSHQAVVQWFDTVIKAAQEKERLETEAASKGL
ncbi:MAG TPA: metallo-beta-lactamase [Bryobacteraceae bacterium]|nr:metallo-beta-lactamase [Bryobacteraceae bacterium]